MDIPETTPDKRKRIIKRELRNGVPCGLHSGCLNHMTHPCEGCGRINGRYPENPSWNECWQCRGDLPEDYEHPTCCSGHECGCMGMPTEPPFCSKECSDKWHEEYKKRISKIPER